MLKRFCTHRRFSRRSAIGPGHGVGGAIQRKRAISQGPRVPRFFVSEDGAIRDGSASDDATLMETGGWHPPEADDPATRIEAEVASSERTG